MKRESLKHRERREECADGKSEFLASVGKCEWCQLEDGAYVEGILGGHIEIEQHEIARGYADRMKALDKLFAILALCRECHTLSDRLPREAQLALLKISRPENYDLRAFHALTARNYPDQEAVDRWVRRFTLEAWQ